MIGYQPIVIDPDHPIGTYVNVYEARAVDKRVRALGKRSGGAVTAILLYLLEEKLVDTVIVARKKKGLRGEAYLARTPREILEAAGPKWSIVPYTLGLKEKLVSPEVKKAVFVGLPCQAQFLRQMKMFPLMESDFSRKIYLIISLFCMGTFAVESFLDYMYRSYKISPEDISGIEVRGEELVVRYKDGELSIRIEEALPYLQHGCLTCPDYTGVFADISAGSSPTPGYTVLITRNKLADKIVRDAANSNYIEIHEATVKIIEEISEKGRSKIFRSYKYLSAVL